MKLPNEFETSTGDSNTHVVLLKRNFYGQKQAGRIWNQHLVKGLMKIGFQPFVVDECVFYKNNTMLFCCVDDGVFVRPNNLDIDEWIKDLRELKHKIEKNDDTEGCIGINFERKDDSMIKLS